MNIFKPELDALNKFTAKCRPDMHEPDEQGISKAKLVGNHLDNAMGGDYTQSCGEYHLILTDDDGKTLDINLAVLIALARSAKL